VPIVYTDSTLNEPEYTNSCHVMKTTTELWVNVGRRYRRGYKNVINKGIELNNEGIECELMMETSGHGALRENRFLDDGAYMSVKLIIEAARRRWEGRKDIRCSIFIRRGYALLFNASPD
jgi:hypothetical protein